MNRNSSGENLALAGLILHIVGLVMYIWGTNVLLRKLNWGRLFKK